MRIGVAVSGCDLGDSGISRYLKELLMALATLPGKEEYLLFGSEAALDYFDPGSERFLRAKLPDRRSDPIPNILWNATGLRRFCSEQRLDVLFFPAANRRIPFRPGIPALGTVHDLSSLHMVGKYPPSHELYIHRVVPYLIRHLDHIIAISEATKSDLVDSVRVDAERITVIPHGVDLQGFSAEASKKAEGAARSRFNLQRPYFLYLSRIEHPGKNHVPLIRAFNRFKERTGSDLDLVLAGKDWDRAELVHREAEASPVRSSIVFTGFVPVELLAGLYGGATALFFPSLFEGFGMPILEAMAAGVPVFCSDRSSLPEVGGDAARYFDPENQESMINSMIEATDPSTLAAMIRAGLDRVRTSGWDTTATATLNLLREIAEGKNEP